MSAPQQTVASWEVGRRGMPVSLLQTFIESAPLAYEKQLDRIKPTTDPVEVAV